MPSPLPPETPSSQPVDRARLVASGVSVVQAVFLLGFCVFSLYELTQHGSDDAARVVTEALLVAVFAAGLLALSAVAISWLSVALGMVPKDVETASNLPMFLILLPFLSSGFVPTDSMPDGLSWFAENQPFTPIIETVRGLLLGTPIGNSGLLAVAWCVAISIVGYLWARRLYERDRAR